MPEVFYAGHVRRGRFEVRKHHRSRMQAFRAYQRCIRIFDSHFRRISRP